MVGLMIRKLHTQILRTIVVVSFFVMPATAQDDALALGLATKDDRGFIVGLLENALGGEGRIVRVDGFFGALSSTAIIRQITIADNAGIWLTLDGLQLDWSRSALLRGRIEIDRLGAEQLKLDRLPSTPETDMPAAASAGFFLPKLPVSVAIDAFEIKSILLGAPVLGAAAELSVNASAQLADGSGEVVLNAMRIDGQQGRFEVDASYADETQVVVINLDLIEAEDGMISRMLNLPGRPALRLQIKGTGNIDDLVTDISLKTDGDPRLIGEVTLRGDTVDGRNFGLNLAGDLTPIVPAEYHQFFGKQTVLNAAGVQGPDGSLALSDLVLKTGAVSLEGIVELNPSYWPTKLALTGDITPPSEGTSVVLPAAEGSTSIQSAALVIAYDSTIGEDLEATFDIVNLVTDGISVRATKLDAHGALGNAFDGQNKFDIKLNFRADGTQFDDVALQRAIGDKITGSTGVQYQTNGGLRLDDIVVAGTDYEMAGTLVIEGLSDAFETQIDVALIADRLARFSTLAGQDLNGQAQLNIVGTADLGGAFDLKVIGHTTDLKLGIAQADKALAGITTLNLDVIRDADGLRLPRLDVVNQQVQVSGSGRLETDASQVEFDALVANSAQIDPNLKGPIALKGRANQDATGWLLDTVLQGPFDSTTTLKGRATGTAPSLDFDIQIPDIQPLAGQFRGAARVDGTATLRGDIWSVDTDLNAPYGINGALSGSVTGTAPNLRYRLNVPNVGALGVGIQGPLSLDGTAAQQGTAWRIDTTLSGLSGLRAQISGSVLTNGNLDLTTTGTAPMALANPFIAPQNIQGQAALNLSLNGPPALTSLSGDVTTSQAKLVVPNLRVSLTDIAAQIGLNRGRAQVDLTGAVSSGGRITVKGPVVITGSNSADLAIALNNVGLVDPALYDTTVDGQITLRGPLTGGAVIAGQINVGETNIRVPESQGAGFSIIPQITHIGPTTRGRETLKRAKLDAASTASSDSSSSAAPFGLDIRIDAPARVYVRGRGLDAELGGALTLRGTTNNVISAGRFNLVRGRLDILGKRFDLNGGSIALQGSLDPSLRFVATTRTALGTASIVIEGSASEPEVTFTSSPELPQDEVLAQIFFGRDASTLSAFQALQLANAVRTLAGKGGDGIVAQLRRSFGLDDFDVTTGTGGVTELSLGKYLSDNIYTDVTIGSDSTAGVSINIDLTPSITARGTLKSDGDSSIGIFLEKDY